MDPEKKMNFIFPTKCVIPESLKFSHWPSKIVVSNPESLKCWAPIFRFYVKQIRHVNIRRRNTETNQDRNVNKMGLTKSNILEIISDRIILSKKSFSKCPIVHRKQRLNQTIIRLSESFDINGFALNILYSEYRALSASSLRSCILPTRGKYNGQSSGDVCKDIKLVVTWLVNMSPQHSIIMPSVSLSSKCG